MADFSCKNDAWFAEWTARWDAMQDAYVPHRREVFALIAEVLAERFPERCRVADIGAGAGTLAEEILNRVPASTVLCLDVEPFLLEAARRRLRTFAGRATVARCDLRKEDFTAKIAEHTEKDGGRLAFGTLRATRPTSTDPDGGRRGTRPTSTDLGCGGSVVGRVPYATKGSRPPEPRSGVPQDLRKEVFTAEITESAEKRRYDAVVTSTTTHWFGQERLQALYTWAARVLTDDGLVQVFDHIPPDDPHLARLALDLAEAERASLFQTTGAMTWEAFWDGLGTELSLDKYYDTVARPAWGTQDGPETGHPLSVHECLLNDVGFEHVALIWRHLSDAILVAQRRSPS